MTREVKDGSLGQDQTVREEDVKNLIQSRQAGSEGCTIRKEAVIFLLRNSTEKMIWCVKIR